MKRLFIVLMLICCISSVSYGAESRDIYVRQDVFDAKMEALFERLHGEIVTLSAKIDSEFAKVNGRIDGLSGRIDKLEGRIDKLEGRIDRLEGRIDGMDYKIDVLQVVIYWGLGILTLLVGSFVLAPLFSSVIQNLRRPSLTLDEIQILVQRLIEENNLKMKNTSQL